MPEPEVQDLAAGLGELILKVNKNRLESLVWNKADQKCFVEVLKNRGALEQGSGEKAE